MEANGLLGRPYAEPFAGGAGLAVKLLLCEDVPRIVLNDADRAVYCLWWAVVRRPEDLCGFVEDVVLDLATWRHHRDVYVHAGEAEPLELAEATLYLNRTNVSGILGARPMGGLGQQGAVAPPGGYVCGAVGHCHAVPVVSAAWGLNDEGPSDRGTEFFQLGLVLDARPRGTRDPHVGEALAHGQLVLRVQEGARRGLNGDEAGRLLHRGGRDVLVLEGEDVRAVDERADRVQVSGLSHRFVDGHLTGRAVRGLDEGAKVNAERDCTLLHHARQLAASDDSDARGGFGRPGADDSVTRHESSCLSSRLPLSPVTGYTGRVPPTQLARRFLRGQTFREWFVEFLQFCTVGLGAYVVDVGLFNLLAHTGLITLPGDQSMTAKIISVTVSVIFSWVANRLWTFKEKRSADKTREFAMFVLVNLGGMLIALGCLAFSRYTLGLTSQFADNVSANVVGLILGTAFRYVMYRYVVFSPGSL